jgi:hypothetical protein
VKGGVTHHKPVSRGEKSPRPHHLKSTPFCEDFQWITIRIQLWTNGGFQIQQNAGHISVTEYDGRLLLFAGYHRSFAEITRENPDGIARSLVVALTTDGEFLISPASSNQGVREVLRGLRPPLLADFLDERLSMRVRLRKKKCELKIQSRIEWLDDES